MAKPRRPARINYERERENKIQEVPLSPPHLSFLPLAKSRNFFIPYLDPINAREDEYYRGEGEGVWFRAFYNSLLVLLIQVERFSVDELPS